MTTTTSRRGLLAAPTVTMPDTPQLPRRGFLGRVAVALTIGTAANAGAILARPAPAAPALPAILPPAEGPELLALGQRLDRLSKAFHAAVALREDARKSFLRARPATPDRLVVKAKDRFFGCAELEFGHVGDRRVISSRLLEMNLRRFGSARSAQWNSRCRSLIKIAAAHEDAVDQARSGLAEACDDVRAVRSEIRDLAADIRKWSPQTMAGVLIHARMVVLFKAMILDRGILDHGADADGEFVANIFGAQMAEALLRLHQEGVS